MQRWQKIALILLAIAVAVFVGSFLFPAEYYVCAPNDYTHTKECAPHHFGPFVFLGLIAVSDIHNGIVTALATVFVAFFTWTLWRSNDAIITQAAATKALAEQQFALEAKQADLAERQHGLQRLQFFATHKPKLEIKFARMAASTTESRIQDVEFSIINTGTSECTVTGSRVVFARFTPGRIATPDDLIGEDVIPHRRFGAGQRDRAIVSPLNVGTLPNDGRSAPYLMGWVVYEDARGTEFGDVRTTYFCRRYDFRTQSFAVASEYPDWEFTH